MLDIRPFTTDIFDRIKGANDYSLDQICAIVSVDILSRLEMGVIGKDTIKGFYHGENISSKNLEKIGAWIDHYYLYHNRADIPILSRYCRSFCQSLVQYYHIKKYR
ncbi:hypothetical protein GLOIN_2v1787821 [Rhizophagus irregularis DAOM 181602=DAOM 197198]|uniref:Uncharacterized protein n=1 Tax=Rhizophagus irregularis (strain DAOM 197198w) TaxID=1432141 RepID=A0A015KEU6_RHIIW|nr:hypothetical protein RirG_128090 [Rhizophagus irregularis DAOM 197198w]GBC42937.1 hypothetical protein GLOIN_2v1787821 [Rhizophagus irregularis DAOM 181602=DAOM 197198]